MKKRYKVAVISACVLLLIISALVLFGTIYLSYFSDKNVSYEFDERLFLMSRGSTVTEYYGNVSIPGEEYKFEKIESLILGEKKKLWVSLDEVSDYLVDGFICVEDRKFYSHSGMDVKRTLYALANSVFHFKSTFGASTITQQVVKNMSGDNDVSFKRKLSEIIRAYNIERNHTKNEILEVYLNIIPMGENLYGVSTASRVYFGKDADELNIQEAATLIGITNAPSRYNPHDNPEKCLSKRNDVLFSMYSCGIIDEAEYDDAASSSLGVLPKSDELNPKKSWFIETVNGDVVAALREKLNLSEYAAWMLLYNGGFKIYTTQNPTVQNELEQFFENTDNFSSEVKNGLEYSMVVSDSSNGNLLGIVGAVGEKRADKVMNHALVPHTPGSTLKPLALYAPLINDKKINWATVFDDVPVEFFNKGSYYVEYPHNSPDIYDGLTTVSNALRLSKNTVAMRLYGMLGGEKIYNQLKNSFGFDTLVEHMNAKNGSVFTDIAPAPLALGQLSYGVSLRKLTEAYTTFPSDGVFTSGRSFLYVYDSDGNLIIDNAPQQKRVFSSDTARIMNMLLSQVVQSGTASAITLKNDVDTAGKTGTSGDDRDRLFIGYTPYITAGIWCGYRNSGASVASAYPNHIKIWDKVVTSIHNELLYDAADESMRVFSTQGLQIREYCKDSGKLYSPICAKDPRGVRLERGYFSPDNVPNGLCDRHVPCRYDFLTSAVASDKCPEEYICEVALLNIKRSFPKEIIITDAEYVFYDTDGTIDYGDSYDIPYFKYYIEDGEFVGRGRRRKQFNSYCYIHSE